MMMTRSIKDIAFQFTSCASEMAWKDGTVPPRASLLAKKETKTTSINFATT